MDSLLSKLNGVVKDVITGFDRIVFKGMVRPIMYAAGMESFLASRKVFNKDFKEYAMKQSQAIAESAEELAKANNHNGIIYIPSHNTRKETLAHKSLKNERSKCKHLYYYFDDPLYGFMNVRLQTWASYEIQIAMNGREWLRRSLDAAGCGYVRKGNKFLYIDDYGLAQKLLDEQTRTDFNEVLKGFLPVVFPRMEEVLNPGLSYYWTFWQSEVAKDYIFDNDDALRGLMDDFIEV